MKKIFEVSNEEKQRILNLHESATKKHYMKEQVESPEPTDDSKSDVINVKYPSRGNVEGIGQIEISSEPLMGIYNNGQMFIEADGRQILVPNTTDLVDGKVNYSQIRDLCSYGICGEKVWVPSYEEVGGLRPKWVACQVDDETSVLVPEIDTQNVNGMIVG